MENVSPLLQKFISYFLIRGIFRTLLPLYSFLKFWKNLGKIHNPKSNKSQSKKQRVQKQEWKEELYKLITF
jgi:hypothetical protein